MWKKHSAIKQQQVFDTGNNNWQTKQIKTKKFITHTPTAIIIIIMAFSNLYI
mgnify:CR=1 FL=1